MALPSTGQENWGVPLNQYITNVVLAQATSAAASISSHQAATDPHGDRAYSLALVQPLTSGVNGPNGFLQLSNIGKIPNGVLPTGGGRTSTFDVVKDYGAPTNGTAAASYIQSALNDCGTAGGGEVWVGDGNFGIDSTLYVPGNVWLHLSPGAIMTRLVNGTSGVAPTYMAANFSGSVSSTGAGNIMIEGGSWVFDSQTAAGVPMAFVNGTNVMVKNASIRPLAGSAAVMFAGCTNGYTDNIQYNAASPGARTTYSGTAPAVRVESAVSSVISGLNSGMYTAATCNAIFVRGCSITGATASDGTGLYTVFNGIAGTMSPQSAAYHTEIIVTGNTAMGLPYNGVTAANWKTMTVMGNQLVINNGSTASVSWTPSTAPSGQNQIVVNNGASDTEEAAGATLFQYLPAYESKTGTTMALDTTLQTPVTANTIYQVTVVLMYQCNSTSAGIQWDFQIPTSAWMPYSATMPYFVSSSIVSGTFQEQAGTPENTSTGGSGQYLAIQMSGLLYVAATAGTFGLKWAQANNTPSSPLYLQAGSFISLTPVT